MEALYLVRYGAAAQAFARRPLVLPALGAQQVRIKVEAFGLNFADVMARLGLYREAPPLPAVLGYEVVGRVEETGLAVTGLEPGQRVLAFTRFGGYATHVHADYRALIAIPHTMDAADAVALATQGCTAWYAAEQVVRLRPGEHVLVQAAAGGVGSLLVQLAKQRGCVVYGTAGSPEKLNLLRELGVDYPINYRQEPFAAAIQRLRGEQGLDAVFDNLGGKAFRTALGLLAPGGRIVGFGAAERLERSGPFATLRLALGFGFHNPVRWLMASQTVAGVNMLRVADRTPQVLQEGMTELLRRWQQGEIRVVRGGSFTVNQLAEAHEALGGRLTTGKVLVRW